jgi:uncharacterized protein YdbL (DUF1318 family)
LYLLLLKASALRQHILYSIQTSRKAYVEPVIAKKKQHTFNRVTRLAPERTIKLKEKGKGAGSYLCPY